MLLEHVLDLLAGQRQRHQLIAERLAGEQIGVGHRAILLPRNIGAHAAGIGEGDHRAAVCRGAGRGELGVGDDIAERALAGIVGHARQRFRHRARRTVGDRRGNPVVGFKQRGLFGVLGKRCGADDVVVGLGADDVARDGIELEVDRGDERAVFVAAGDKPSVDLADIGLMGVAGDHHIDRAIEFFDDVDDRARDARALIIVAGRRAAFVDQHHDGLDAARLQFGHQRIHRLGLVAEFETGRARPAR